jgi:hypothetical protein
MILDCAPWWRAWLAALLACALGACGGGSEADATAQPAREQAAMLAGVEPITPLPPLASPPLASPPLASRPLATSVVAYSSPTGLIASTGNLYWTSTAVDEFGADVSTVWRAGKYNVPGNETALWREYGDDRSFGDIVFANPGTFYGYFVAHYRTQAGMVSRIKRVPLAGGSAVVIANSPAAHARDLRTDGTTLYWIDDGGIRSVPLAGGAVRTLYADAFVGRISLDQNFVYFGEEYLVMRIPKAGGAPQFFASTDGRVSALYVDSASQWVFWGDKEGGVYGRPARLGEWTRTYQPPTPGREVKEVGWANGELWVDCLQPGNTSCRIRWINNPSYVIDLVTGPVGIAHLQWDPGANIPPKLYWGDVSYLWRGN